jgi:hypothetical protein
MPWYLIVLHSPIFHGALVGWATAAHVDYSAFTAATSWTGLVTYDWGTASFRWVKGAIGGAIMGAGFGAWLS